VDGALKLVSGAQGAMRRDEFRVKILRNGPNSHIFVVVDLEVLNSGLAVLANQDFTAPEWLGVEGKFMRYIRVAAKRASNKPFERQSMFWHDLIVS
jgi:hypothetical protein